MKAFEKFRTSGGGAKDSAPAPNERKPKGVRHFLQTCLAPQFFDNNCRVVRLLAVLLARHLAAF
ncbi:MAG: hypothetical protein AABW85_06200, partial [archaeon]